MAKSTHKTKKHKKSLLSQTGSQGPTQSTLKKHGYTSGYCAYQPLAVGTSGMMENEDADFDNKYKGQCKSDMEEGQYVYAKYNGVTRIVTMDVNGFITMCSHVKPIRNPELYMAFLAKTDADVICLQNIAPIQQQHPVSEESTITKQSTLQSMTFKHVIDTMYSGGWTYHYLAKHPMTPTENGPKCYSPLADAIFSRYPLTDTKTVLLASGLGSIHFANAVIDDVKTLIANIRQNGSSVSDKDIQAIIERESAERNIDSVVSSWDFGSKLARQMANEWSILNTKPLVNAISSRNAVFVDIVPGVKLSSHAAQLAIQKIKFEQTIDIPQYGHLLMNTTKADKFNNVTHSISDNLMDSLNFKYPSWWASDNVKLPTSVTPALYDYHTTAHQMEVEFGNINPKRMQALTKLAKRLSGAPINLQKELAGATNATVPFTLNYKPTPGGLKHSGTSVPRHSEAQPEGWAYNRVSTVRDNLEMDIDEIMLYYLKTRKDLRTIVLWPACDWDKDKDRLRQTFNMLNTNGRIFYTKRFMLNYNEACALMFALYVNTDINKTYRNVEYNTGLKGWAKTKPYEKRPILVFFYEYTSGPQAHIAGNQAYFKMQLRDIWKHDKIRLYDILHISDFFSEALDNCHMFLNRNSMRMLSSQNIDRFIKLMNQELYTMINLLKSVIYTRFGLLDINRFNIISSFGLFILGLRRPSDIDGHMLGEFGECTTEFRSKFLEYFTVQGKSFIPFVDLVMPGAPNYQEYMRTFFDKIALIFGAPDHREIILNPRYHQYFYGIKMPIIPIDIVKRIFRFRPKALSDIISIDRILKYRVRLPSIPDKIEFYYRANINPGYIKKTIRNYLNMEYNIKLSTEEIDRYFTKYDSTRDISTIDLPRDRYIFFKVCGFLLNYYEDFKHLIPESAAAAGL